MQVNEQWREAIKKLGLTCCSSGKIIACMLHFHPSDLYGIKTRHLKPGAMPSIRTRPFDPLLVLFYFHISVIRTKTVPFLMEYLFDTSRWQTRANKSFETQQFDDFIQMNPMDSIKCVPNDESTTPSNDNSHSGYVLVLGLLKKFMKQNLLKMFVLFFRCLISGNQLTNQASQIELDPLTESETYGINLIEMDFTSLILACESRIT